MDLSSLGSRIPKSVLLIFFSVLFIELQAEQILTGSRAGIYEKVGAEKKKVGAESRADTKLLQFFAFFAFFMPFLYR